MDTVSVAGVRIAAAAAAEGVVVVVVAEEALPLLFLLAGGAVADCCEAAMSKAFLLRVVGAVVKDVLSAYDETARYMQWV